MTALSVFIFISALWRLVSLYANEDGPFNIFRRVRSNVKELDERYPLLHDFRLYDGYTCEWCLSIWIAVPMSLCWYAFGEVVVYIVFPFAASTWTIVIKYVVQTLADVQSKLNK